MGRSRHEPLVDHITDHTQVADSDRATVQHDQEVQPGERQRETVLPARNVGGQRSDPGGSMLAAEPGGSSGHSGRIIDVEASEQIKARDAAQVQVQRHSPSKMRLSGLTVTKAQPRDPGSSLPQQLHANAAAPAVPFSRCMTWPSASPASAS